MSANPNCPTRPSGRPPRHGAHAVLAPVLLLVLALVGLPAPADAASAASEAAYAEDELIIVYEDEPLELDEPLDVGPLTTLEASGSLTADVTLEDVGVVAQEQIVESASGGAVVLAELDGNASVEEVIERIEDDPAIAYAQPNYTYELLSTTSDTYFSSDVEDEYNQYYLFGSNFDDAWDSVRVEGAVTVAVLDTGCRLSHEDLAGTVDTELAWDVTTGTLLAEAGVDNDGDANGHGTMVCGIIAAYADNAVGIAGASYNATILPVKVFDDSEECETSDVLAAYGYLDGLIGSGELDDLRVINMSIGMYTSGETEGDRALRGAIADMLEENDVLTVCAGGNSSSSENCYPADYEECVSVVALDTSGSVASFSDANDEKDLCAYGEDILSTSADGGYEEGSGTSFAAPQVAAAAALLWAADPDLSAGEVVAILEDTAAEVSGSRSEGAGAGLVDAGAAVLEALGEGEDDADAGEDGGGDADGSGDGSFLFTDVQDSSKYYFDAVYDLYYLGYVTGVGDGTAFGVGQKMTREQFVTILWRMAEPEAYAECASDGYGKSTSGLSDVADGKYYTDAVNWAWENDVVAGYSNGEFGVGDAMTFEQMTTIIARYAAGGDSALNEAMTDSQAAKVLAQFADGSKVSSWADNGMAYLVEEGLVNGNARSDGTLALSPSSNVTRERAVTVLSRAVEADLF